MIIQYGMLVIVKLKILRVLKDVDGLHCIYSHTVLHCNCNQEKYVAKASASHGTTNRTVFDLNDYG